MKLGTFLVTALLSTQTLAGKFEIIGEGTATLKAEFIRLNILIASECHISALNARQQVDQLTQKALAALEKYKTDLPSQVLVSPKANTQKIKTDYIDGRNVVICDTDHSWTSATAIEFKLSDSKLLAEVQDALLNLNTGKAIALTDINQDRLVLSMSQPAPGVLAETWDTLSDLALQRAHTNALRQVNVLSQGVNNPKIELMKVAATQNASGQVIYDRVDSEGDTSGASLGTVSLKLSRQFTFKVEAQ